MKIVSEEQLGKFQLLKVDGVVPSVYSHVLINGERFEKALTHNINESVAIESENHHVGMELTFVVPPLKEE